MSLVSDSWMLTQGNKEQAAIAEMLKVTKPEIESSKDPGYLNCAANFIYVVRKL